MENKIIGIFGRKGSGKTYFTKKSILPEFNKKIILDKNGEYWGGAIFTNYNTFKEFYSYVKDLSNYTLILRFMSIEDYTEFFENVHTLYNTTLVIDEANFFFPPISTPDTVKNMVAISRHLKLNIIFLSRRVFEVTPMLRSQADEIITFRQTEARDLNELRSYGFNPNEVNKLPNYSYIRQNLA